MSAVSGYRPLLTTLQALYKLSDEYKDSQTALRIMRDLIVRGKYE
jgi:hypothetical protein